MRPVRMIMIAGALILLVWLAVSSDDRGAHGNNLRDSSGLAVQENSDEVVAESIQNLTNKADKDIASRPESNDKKNLELAFRRKIEITGTVVDHEDQPIPFAKIKYSINDRILRNPRKDSGTTDSDGRFTYSTKARAVSVIAEKDGYYSDMNSKASIKAPAKESVILKLTKRGTTEPLRLSSKGFKLIKDGTPVGVILKKVERSDVKSADIIVSAQKDNDGGVENGKVEPWSWRCKISVPGGGIVYRDSGDRYDFIAPETGYWETFVYEEPKDQERWSSSFEDEFFVKLSDDTYTRIEVFFTSFNEEPYIEIKSYYNPSGSRNLEFDKSKQIN